MIVSLSFFLGETGGGMDYTQYTQKGQVYKPYKSIGDDESLPWCTVVAGCDDLSIGGVIHDPVQEAIDPKRPGLPKSRLQE
jgi:hypothetical protein